MRTVALTLVPVFVIPLLGLVVYVLWNRRRFRRESSVSDDVESSGVSSGSGRVLPHPISGKELVLYCLCLKNQSRIEPAIASLNTTTVFNASVNPVFLKPPQPPAEEEEANDDELEMEKLRHESMLLYTINEEDEEEEELEEAVVESKVDVQEEDEPTSFLSACSSPLYSTPASSPPRVTSQTSFHPTILQEEAEL